eukprot:jgi/Tetstr1/440811/TSEL_029118.t1
MTLVFESEYAHALECLRIYDTLEERKKAAPSAGKFELLTRGGGQLEQQADERRDTLQEAAAPAELGAARANEWESIAKTEVGRILVVVCGSSQGQAPAFRSGCGALSDVVALCGEAYKAEEDIAEFICSCGSFCQVAPPGLAAVRIAITFAVHALPHA